MKKLISTAALLLFTITFSFSQGFFNGIELKATYGYQKHDKRFWAGAQEQNDGDWGTSYYAVRVTKKFWDKKWLSLSGGLGYAKEINTYHAPYNHCFTNPNGPCTLILAWMSEYKINLVQTPIILKIPVAGGLNAQFGIIPQFDFLKKIIGIPNREKFSIGLYSIEFLPEVAYDFGKINFNLGYRLFQLKSIDRVYHYGNTFKTANPGYFDKTFDTYNPTKFTVSIGYEL